LSGTLAFGLQLFEIVDVNMSWRLAFDQLIGIMPEMSLRFWSFGYIFELDKVIFAEIPGIYFELKVLELCKDFVIVKVPIGQQDVLLFVD
jgi:hypothetical protein